MRRLALVFIFTAALLLASYYSRVQSEQGSTTKPPAGTLHKGPAFRFNKITDDVYHAVGTGVLTVGSNSSVIVNEDDVVLVDAHISPAAAWVLLDELKQITNKPVRYVIDTHFHYDHAHGNQVFGKDVEIIGHEFTRDMLLGNVAEKKTYKNYLAGLPTQIENLKKQLAAESDPARKENLQRRLESAQNNLASQAELKPTPPTVTLRTKMTLYRGNREFQLIYLGRGHTGGDVVVYLPKERILCSGDLLTDGVSYMGDGFVNEWINTLDEMKKLDFQTILPGHGNAFTDRAKIDYFQAYLRDIWDQVSRLKQQGVPAAEAAKRVDVTKHREHFPGAPRFGVDEVDVARMYEVLGLPK